MSEHAKRALIVAISAGDSGQIEAAADQYIAAAKSSGVVWMNERVTRFMILPLDYDDWGAIMLSGQGAVEGPRLWARHLASRDDPAELGLLEFIDLLYCRLVAADVEGLPLNPEPLGPLKQAFVVETELLRSALDAITEKNAGNLREALRGLELMNTGPIFLAGILAVAQSRGVELTS